MPGAIHARFVQGILGNSFERIIEKFSESNLWKRSMKNCTKEFFKIFLEEIPEFEVIFGGYFKEIPRKF